MGLPRISAVVPVYNRSHCVGQAIWSILRQNHAVDEILVVDDGSTDELEAAVAPFGKRISLVRHSANLGAAAARNSGIRRTAGDFVAFLDSDDSWAPEKLARQIAFMQDRALDASCTGFEILPEPGGSPAVAWRPYPEILGIQDIAWGCYCSPGSTLVVRRDIMKEVGGYDTAFPRYEDWDFLLRLAERESRRIGFLDLPLATVHAGSHVESARAFEGLDRIIERHVETLRYRDPKLARRLRSAVAFNRASIHSRAGRKHVMLAELAKSLLLCPMGNWPFRVILPGAVSGVRARSA